MHSQAVNILIGLKSHLLEKYVIIFSNPFFFLLSYIFMLLIFSDFLMNIFKIKTLKKNEKRGLKNRSFNVITKNDQTDISFGCCWRYDSKKRIHGRMFVNEKNITFFSPFSLMYENEDLISNYSVFPGINITEVTKITMEYTKITRMVRRGGSKVLRGSVTIEIHSNFDKPLELMFCHFLHTKFVYDLLSKLCTLSCARIYNKIKCDKSISIDNALNESEKSIENINKIRKLNYDSDVIIPNEVSNFLLYNIQDKLPFGKNSEDDNLNLIELLNKRGSNEFEEFINEYDYNLIPTTSLPNVYPCLIMPLELSKVFSILSDKSNDSCKNVYLHFLESSGATNIEIESKPSKGEFMQHFVYRYEKSINIASGIGLGWLSMGQFNVKCEEDLKLYNLGDEMGILLCIDVNSTGIPENDAFTVNLRHRFTPFIFISDENHITESNNKKVINPKNYVQLDIECDVTFNRFSFFKSPVVQNTIDQTKRSLEFIRNSWKMHY